MDVNKGGMSRWSADENHCELWMKMDRVRVWQRAPTPKASTGIKNVWCNDTEMPEGVKRYEWTLLLVVLYCPAYELGRASVLARGNKLQDNMAQCWPFSMGSKMYNVQHYANHMVQTCRSCSWPPEGRELTAVGCNRTVWCRSSTSHWLLIWPDWVTSGTCVATGT